MRPACSCMMPRKRSCASRSPLAGPRKVSMKPIRVAIGVFSSWLTLAMKSLRSRSSRCSALASLSAIRTRSASSRFRSAISRRSRPIGVSTPSIAPTAAPPPTQVLALAAHHLVQRIDQRRMPQHAHQAAAGHRFAQQLAGTIIGPQDVAPPVDHQDGERHGLQHLVGIGMLLRFSFGQAGRCFAGLGFGCVRRPRPPAR